MTTVPDISVVRLPAPVVDGDEGAPAQAPASIWAIDPSEGRRPSPLALTVLGVVAGVAAMVLGGVAVIAAGSTSSDANATAPAPSASEPVAGAEIPGVERKALALLAKPSTERIAFRGAQGLVLAVGSGGRAAILVRGLERAPSGRTYGAWVVTPGSAPVLAARFVGTERAVFLNRPLGPRASVVVSTGRSVAGPPARDRLVALRG